MRWLFLFFALYALPAAPASDLPDLGEPSQEVISPIQERQIGEQAMMELLASKRLLDDPEIDDYLNQLGARLVGHSNEPAQDFMFFAVKDHSINAFALPGGYVGVHTGLILLAQTESELAAVLAHEITHVTRHHLARMIAKSQKFDTLALAAMIVAIMASARNNPSAATGAAAGASAGMMQSQLAFTFENEQEADRLGLNLMEKSGFDTRAMPAFFERMQRSTSPMETNAPNWVRNHPVTSDRIADIDNRVHDTPFRLVPDSLDFQLVRSKLLALDRKPHDAIRYFSDALSGPRKFGNPVAQRYGLAFALQHSGNAARARKEVAILMKTPQAASNVMVLGLAGRTYHASGMSNEKLAAFYLNALNAHPQYLSLVYDYAEVLIEGRHFDAALKLLNDRIATHSNDPHLYEIQAHVYSALNRPQQEHHALAYARIWRGDLAGCIEQLELAKQSGSDSYELSVIEDELKRAREMAGNGKKKR